MSGSELRGKVLDLKLSRGSKHELIRKLIVDGFFDSPRTTNNLIGEIHDVFGKKFKTTEVSVYMRKFMPDFIHCFKLGNVKGNFWVIASMSKDQAIKSVSKNERILAIEEDLFSEELIEKLSRDFSIELEDLRHNFGKSGNCTAFLLRKILEKLIYITFSKNGIGAKLEDKTKSGRLVGLETMINLASLEKMRGAPFLTSRTANEIKGIKFLGDVAAHNPLADVDMKTIVLQMPFIITAYKELIKKL